MRRSWKKAIGQVEQKQRVHEPRIRLTELKTLASLTNDVNKLKAQKVVANEDSPQVDTTMVDALAQDEEPVSPAPAPAAAVEEEAQPEVSKPPERRVSAVQGESKQKSVIEHPSSRPDEAEETASIELFFNCNRCPFEVVDGDIDALPIDSMFNLNAAKSRTAIGLVRVAAGKTMPFHERIVFPEKWLSGKEHGLVHNGYQGEGLLDLTLEYRVAKKKVAIVIRVIPWLAYSCSKGARISIRSIGAAQGYTGTVDRLIVNYPSPGSSRWVVRLDNKAVGDKNEEIVDVKPENCVLCQPTAYEKGTRIHLLHGKVSRDARVVNWLGAMEGSKYTLELEEYTAEDGAVVTSATVDTCLNECNHAVERFDTAAEYIELRKARCAELRDENEFVEDAITQRLLRISEQYILMRVIQATGEKARADWKRIDSVKNLVKVLVEGSPDRTFGTHHAMPCLVVAGPGAGKTWMLKQLTHLVASSLHASDEPGIRLIPIVVFVQRIVRLLRDTNMQMSKLVKKRGLFNW